ncbi:uncharacterized protein LOC126836656 isoform X2 [Adelges cooleyi]|uniref:uncharacterized protein LOC126836656 isoform X2 n=1 Tax=Adelges cooleyi TaxID=133065 RepID=UPI0021808AFC|nr:uncharacterized protein LOC126836656 isoform X2 [Adelges cooleyi]
MTVKTNDKIRRLIMASNKKYQNRCHHSVYRWIERKPLSEAILWTSREKFWLITATCHFGIHNWKSVAQVVKNAGESYRPKEGWYTPKNCERQFKMIVSSYSREVKSLPFNKMLRVIADSLKRDYVRDVNKSKDSLKTKYFSLFSVMNRVKQGNLTRNEVVNLYAQARRNEIEGKQYIEQLMARQNSSLASDNFTSGTTDEPIKWNTPSAPLLTSLLRSRNTIPANRTASTIASLLQPPAGTSRTRSGKLLPLTTSPNAKTAQGTPTLSKLLEAPANPYIRNPSQPINNKPSAAAGSDKSSFSVLNNKKDAQTSSTDRIIFSECTIHLKKLDAVMEIKRDPTKEPFFNTNSPNKTISGNACIVNLLSDSEIEEENRNTVQGSHVVNSLGEKKDGRLIELRSTRSQTRAEGGSFKNSQDVKSVYDKKDQQTGGTHDNQTILVDDDLFDIDNIDVEPLTSVQDQTQSPLKTTLPLKRVDSSSQNSIGNQSFNKYFNSSQVPITLDDIPLLNTSLKTVASEYKNLMVGQSRVDSPKVSERYVPFDSSAIKDAIVLRKDNQTFSTSGNNMLAYDGQLLKQRKIIEIKGTNLKCFDTRGDTKFLSFVNQPFVVVNKIKKPFNIKLSSELKDKSDDTKIINIDPKKNIKILNSSQNVIKIIDGSNSVNDEVIVIDDDSVNNSSNEEKSTNIKPLPNKSNNLMSIGDIIKNITASGNSKTEILDDNKSNNVKSTWDLFGKVQSDLLKKNSEEESMENSGNFIKGLDLDFNSSITHNSLTDLYNGEEIVNFDHEDINSIIESGSLEISKTEETQITENTQKDISYKANKSVSPELSVKKDNEKCDASTQPDDLDDDQNSSVTGIPILQGVILDVMSKIDLDRAAALKQVELEVKPPCDIVEISSDDEESNTIKRDDEAQIIVADNDKTVNTINEISIKETILDKKTSDNIENIDKDRKKDEKYIVAQETSKSASVLLGEEMGQKEIEKVELEAENTSSNRDTDMQILKDAELKEAEAKILKESEQRILEEKKKMEAQLKKLYEENRVKEIERKHKKETETKINKVLEEAHSAAMNKKYEIDNNEKGEKLTKAKEVDAETLTKDEEIKNNGSKQPNETLPNEYQTKQSEDIGRETRRSRICESDVKSKSDLKSVEQELEKSMIDEFKKINEMETINVETKNHNKTKGLKIEEILSVTKPAQGKSNKSEDPQLFDDVGSTSSTEKQSSSNGSPVQITDYNKCVSSQIIEDIKLITNSSVVLCNKIKDENYFVSNENNIKTKTRSSANFKDTKLIETKSSLPPYTDEINEVDTSSRSLEKVKDRSSTLAEVTTTNAKHQVQSRKSLSPPITDMACKASESVRISSASDDTPVFKKMKLHRIESNNEDQQYAVANLNEAIKPNIANNGSEEKPAPKKRGRKRRIDQLNEQQPNSDKSSVQDAMSEKDLSDSEPSVKRTRKSVQLNIEPRENRKERSDETLEEKKSNKKSLKLIFNNLRQIKYFSMFEKPLKNIPAYKHVHNSPLDLKEVKKKIDLGDIRSLDELQLNLMLMSFNAVMLNPSYSTICNDATSLQVELKSSCRLLHGVFERNNYDGEEEEDEGGYDDDEEEDEDNDDMGGSDRQSTTTDDSQPKRKKRKMMSSSDDDTNDDRSM